MIMVYVIQLDIIFSPNVLIKSMLINLLWVVTEGSFILNLYTCHTSGKRVGEVKNYLRKERMQLHIS